MRDANGNRIAPGEYANQLMSRAEGLRANAGFLTSNDREPFKEATQSLIQSEQHLSDIRAELKAVRTDED
jgi:hypothetical protein